MARVYSEVMVQNEVLLITLRIPWHVSEGCGLFCLIFKVVTCAFFWIIFLMLILLNDYFNKQKKREEHSKSQLRIGYL